MLVEYAARLYWTGTHTSVIQQGHLECSRHHAALAHDHHQGPTDPCQLLGRTSAPECLWHPTTKES